MRDKGATGNSSTNDIAAIHAAINQVAGTDSTVLAPGATYLVDAVAQVLLKSNMTLRMTSGAILKAIPNNQDNYGIIRNANASNVNVINGTVQGAHAQRLATTV